MLADYAQAKSQRESFWQCAQPASHANTRTLAYKTFKKMIARTNIEKKTTPSLKKRKNDVH